MLSFALVAALQFGTTAVVQPQHSVFGLDLQSSLEIPVCAKGRYGLDEPPSHGACQSVFERPVVTDVGTVEVIRIAFSEADMPGIATGAMLATLIDGKMEALQFHTLGTPAIPSVMEALTEKYGAPTKVSPYKLTNGYGASVDSQDAEWLKGPVKVTYIAQASGKMVGEVYVETEAAYRYRTSKYTAPKDQGTKL